MRNGILACVLIALMSVVLHAQQVQPRPPCDVAPACPAASSSSGDKLDHLLKAAEHLEAAGLTEEAKKLRQQAEKEKHALLARIKCLEGELERLRRMTGSGRQVDQQVLVHMKVLEVERGKLRKLGFDFALLDESRVGKLDVAGKDSPTCAILEDDQALAGVLEALCRDNLARVLARPKLVTLSGWPAFCQVGEEVRMPAAQTRGTGAVEFKSYGTKVDMVPFVLPKGRIRMELRVQVSEPDQVNGVEVDGQAVPAFRTRGVDTRVEIHAGQTLVIGGLVQKRTRTVREEAPGRKDTAEKTEEAADEIELLVLVRPELVEAVNAHEVRQRGPDVRTARPSFTDLFKR
jgi:Flp pilus assembly secretin CpaC